MANPHTAELGEDGEEKWIEIELKSMADIGLIGFPNAGKSSLLAALSRCSPRIAPYPFTTLSPNIGRVFFANGDCISIADLPGLIENAHLNEGLGHAFLRHAERTAILAYVIDISGQSSTEIDEEPTDSKDRGVEDTSNERQVKHREEEEDVVPEVRKKRTSWRSGMPRIPRDPMETFFALFREVCMYSRTLASRPFLIIATKCDVRPEESLRSVDQLWKALNSTRTREKLQQLLTEEKARDYDRLQSPISAADSSSKDNKGRDELLSQSDHFFAAFSSSSPDKIRDCETHGKCMQMKRLTRKEVEGESQQETKGDEEVFAQKKETERERQRNPREHQMIHQ
ncbi:gtpase, partial [Cystoisospora suis]